MSDPQVGPWMGVPQSKQTVCAVEGCEARGEAHRCLYDGAFHHHGCIHYACVVAQQTGHGLTFREGWCLLCPNHYRTLVEAQIRYKQTAAIRALTVDA